MRFKLLHKGETLSRVPGIQSVINISHNWVHTEFIFTYISLDLVFFIALNPSRSDRAQALFGELFLDNFYDSMDAPLLSEPFPLVMGILVCSRVLLLQMLQQKQGQALLVPISASKHPVLPFPFVQKPPLAPDPSSDRDFLHGPPPLSTLFPSPSLVSLAELEWKPLRNPKRTG